MKIHAFGTPTCRQEGVRLSTDYTIRAPPCAPGDDVVGPS